MTGAPAASYELALTDLLQIPAGLASNIAVDQRLPGGSSAVSNTSTTKTSTASTTSTPTFRRRRRRSRSGRAARWTNARIHQHVSTAIVLKNQSVGSSYNIATTLSRRPPTVFRGAARRVQLQHFEEHVVPVSIAFARGPAILCQPIRITRASATPHRSAAALGHRYYVLRRCKGVFQLRRDVHFRVLGRRNTATPATFCHRHEW